MGWKPLSSKKIIQYRVQREMKKNGYPVPDSKKTMINDTKEPNDAHKHYLKEEILQEITEDVMENI
jgi:hypothetical protein